MNLKQKQLSVEVQVTDTDSLWSQTYVIWGPHALSPQVLSNIDELFDRREFSAAPDPGWPDCFNSGVFVFQPSLETHSLLLQHAVEHGSFDGTLRGSWTFRLWTRVGLWPSL